MQNRISILTLGIVVLLSITCTFGQETSWELISTSGDTITRCKLDSLQNGFLFYSHDRTVSFISIDSLVGLESYKPSRYWKGAGIGFALGSVFGALIGDAAYEEPKPGSWNLMNMGRGVSVAVGAVLGGMGGLIVGGIIGGTCEGRSARVFQLTLLVRIRSDKKRLLHRQRGRAK
jgi:hypothetical protein